MRRSTFSREVFGDRFVYAESLKGDSNQRQLDMMKHEMKSAMSTELTERQRDMVNMYYFDGLSVTEISERCGVNKSTVSRHLKRSREILRDCVRYRTYSLWEN